MGSEFMPLDPDEPTPDPRAGKLPSSRLAQALLIVAVMVLIVIAAVSFH